MLGMEGLSPAANTIVESFSSLAILKDYYLIGGTGLALQITHRLSEDLDFCQWIPSYGVKHGIPVNDIHEELGKKFGVVEKNHLDFSQVNFVIQEPAVKITFYQTTLSKPDFTPIPLIGNISMADLTVLGGSKMYVITKRYALRDFYDLYVLWLEKRLTIQQLVEQAGRISKETTPEILRTVFEGFSFDGNRFKFSDLEKLEPKYEITAQNYVDFCQIVAKEIATLYPEKSTAKKIQEPVQRTAEHLHRKINHGRQFLNHLEGKAHARYQLFKEDTDIMLSVGPYPTHLEVESNDLTEQVEELEDFLVLQSGSIKNFIYNLKERYSLSKEELKAFCTPH